MFFTQNINQQKSPLHLDLEMMSAEQLLGTSKNASKIQRPAFGMRLEIDGISESDTGISTTYDSDHGDAELLPFQANGMNVIDV